MTPSHPDMDLSRPAVQPMKRFKNVLENGQTVESVGPMPATPADSTKYYSSPVQTTSFHREDGKKMPFIFGFYETNLLYDQQYLDAEIASGNPYVRYASEEEITVAHMRLDPRGTITKDVREQIKNDPEFRAQMEAEILERLAASGRLIPDSEKLAGVDAGKTGSKVIMAGKPILTGIGNSKDIAGAAASSGI